jgi:hypothetical protein
VWRIRQGLPGTAAKKNVCNKARNYIAKVSRGLKKFWKNDEIHAHGWFVLHVFPMFQGLTTPYNNGLTGLDPFWVKFTQVFSCEPILLILHGLTV